jgi:hypothetical protein
MMEQEQLFDASNVLLCLALGVTAVLALLPPWMGLGMGVWVEWLCSATAALLVAVRFLWLR